jgi:predicted molibdopterin-dependent oxidoreductase YjgC
MKKRPSKKHILELLAGANEIIFDTDYLCSYCGVACDIPSWGKKTCPVIAELRRLVKARKEADDASKD